LDRNRLPAGDSRRCDILDHQRLVGLIVCIHCPPARFLGSVEVGGQTVFFTIDAYISTSDATRQIRPTLL
jgi:hypothetical protein